jgi:hypothetical protein
MKRTVLLLAFAALLSCVRTASPETHLIPPGYSGVVVVVFNDPKGAPVDLKDRVYRIGNDGYAAVASSANTGLSTSKSRRFLQLEVDGGTTELDYNEALGPGYRQVFGAGMGSFGFPRADGTLRDVSYMSYFVGVPNSRPSKEWDDLSGRIFWELKRRYGEASPPQPDASTPAP